MKKIIASALIAAALVGCESNTPHPEKIALPPNATDVVDIGDGWCTLKLHNQKYIYRSIQSRTYGGCIVYSETLTPVPEEYGK